MSFNAANIRKYVKNAYICSLQKAFRTMKSIYTIIRTVTCMILMLAIYGCDHLNNDFDIDGGGQDSENPNRVPGSYNRNVLILYSAGYNSLSEFLASDIQDLKSGWLPGNKTNDNVMLIYAHSTKKYNDYKTPTSPHLVRLYKNSKGTVIADTLVTYPQGSLSTSAARLNEVLTYVNQKFPAKSYGMIFSSHATGYLPAGYYNNSLDYTFEKLDMMGNGFFRDPFPVPYVEVEQDPSLPMVKSIGEDRHREGSTNISYEMDLPDFAEAIPMKLDYILFDACLMGGIEVAYELKDKCSKIGFSQAEVLAEGLDYKTLTTHLLQNDEPDPQRVCEDYFKQYDSESGVYRSATISYIDCEKLDTLANVCRTIFSNHREELALISPSNTQRFYRSGKHWFYDLESIVRNAKATSEEIRSFKNALNQCVIYAAHTPEFMLEFRIYTFSGFSMYLPCNGGVELDKFYRTLKWNQATKLVE